MAGSKLVVALPAGARVVETGGGAYDSGDNTLTFTLSAVNGGCPGGSFRLTYPASDASNAPGATKSLQITWQGRKVGTVSTASLGTATVSHTLITPAVDSTLTKSVSAPRTSGGTPSGAVGDEVTYNLSATNSGSRTWDALKVSDPLPDILAVTSIAATNPGQDTGSLWVATKKGADGIAGNADDDVLVKAADVPARARTAVVVGTDLTLSAGDYVTRAEFRGSTVYPGVSGTPLSVTGKLLATSRSGVASAAGTAFTNTGTFAITAGAGTSTVARTAGAVVDVPTPGVYVRHSGGTVSVGSRETSFDLSATPVFGDDMADPVFVVELPAHASLKDFTGPSSLPAAQLETVPNWDGAGTTLLRWTFPAGTRILRNAGATMHYTVVLDRTVYTPRTVKGWISSRSMTPSCGDNWSDGSQDTRDRDGDGNTTEVLCPWFAGFNFPTSSSARLTQSVKGSWDSDFADGPASGYTTPGSSDVYRLSIDSEATMNLDRAVAIDVLPRPGDTAVTNGAARTPATATFPVYLRSRPVTPSLSTPVITSYTTVSNPCRPELSYSPAGCNAPNWTNWDTTPPGVLSAVTAVKFDFGANALAPGDRWTVDLPVTTPASGATEPDFAVRNPDPAAAADDEVAYNSTGFVIRRTDLGVDLLPSEAQAVGLDMPSVYGPPGARPTAATRTTSGTGTTVHTTSLSIPAHGFVALMDGLTPVGALHVDGVGDYTLDPATGVVQFTPVLGFQGAAPAVGYRRTDVWGQSAVSSYVATVNPPAGPSPSAKTSTGTEAQAITVAVPTGGTLRLLDHGTPVTSRTVPGVGTYAVSGGQITFTPVTGYAGHPAGVTYEVTDAYGQAAAATYTPAVLAPAPDSVPSGATTGAAGAEQSFTIAVPAGGTATLLGADGRPATSITVDGEGVYALDASGATITFTPAAGFSGRATGVRFEVTDLYGRTSLGTYIPTVTAPEVTPPPAPVSPAECLSRRSIVIHFKVPAHTGLKTLRVTLNGKALRSLRTSERKVTFDMRGRPAGRLVVGIAARTATGRVLRAQRVYQTCKQRQVPPPLATLKLTPRGR